MIGSSNFVFRLLLAPVVAVLLLVAADRAHAQEYPNRPIRLIVGFGAGGASDLTARMLAHELRERLGQAVVIENRPGAGGILAAGVVAQAAPDGYTLLLIAGNNAISTSLFKKLPYDIVADFEPISTLSFFTFAFVTRSDSGIATIGDLIARGKQGGKEPTIGTTAIGGGQHLAAELFKSMSGARALTVPFTNTPASLAALRGGTIDVVAENLPPVYGSIRSGDLRALGVTTAKRFPGLPDVPTVAESGVPGYVADTWNAIVAPAGTPDAIIDKLNREINAALLVPALRQSILNIGAEPRGSTREGLRDHLNAEISKWRAVVENAGIQKQ